jgi:hypothetical protein
MRVLSGKSIPAFIQFRIFMPTKTTPMKSDFHFLTWLILGALFLTSCGNDPAEDPAVVEDAPLTENREMEAPDLVANIDYLRVRKTPGQNGEIIATLSKGDKVKDLGEVSSFTTRVQLRGIWFDEPWIKVQTESGETGWVFAGGLNFAMERSNALTDRLMEIRLQTLFGKDLAKSIEAYRASFRKAGSSEAFAAVYQRGMALRDTLNEQLEQQITVGETADEQPDLFWLEEAMPGFIPQLVAEGTIYYLFADYKEMLEKVSSTKGLEDDEFIDICLTVHQTDSIEYFFPSWMLQTWDYGGHSELGKGVHYQLFEKINTQLAKGTLFEQHLITYKEALLQDIANPDNTYWYTKEQILAELDRIIKADFGLFSEEDQYLLEARREQFEKAEENNISLGLREGQ